MINFIVDSIENIGSFCGLKEKISTSHPKKMVNSSCIKI